MKILISLPFAKGKRLLMYAAISLFIEYPISNIGVTLLIGLKYRNESAWHAFRCSKQVNLNRVCAIVDWFAFNSLREEYEFEISNKLKNQP